MKLSLKKGFSFGLTSGIITTLGMIVGLNEGTHLKSVVMSGILIIAVADSLSDAFGMHISEESENQHSNREIWESTIATFLAKLFFALTFIIPILIFKLDIAVIVGVIWGLIVICLLSYLMAYEQKENTFKIMIEHLIIAVNVVIFTHLIGDFISSIFN